MPPTRLHRRRESPPFPVATPSERLGQVHPWLPERAKSSAPSATEMDRGRARTFREATRLAGRQVTIDSCPGATSSMQMRHVARGREPGSFADVTSL